MSRIEEKVISKIRSRAEAGKAKYGVTLERTDLTTLDWLRHAQEEALDFAAYLEVLIQEKEKAEVWRDVRAGNTYVLELEPIDEEVGGYVKIGRSARRTPR